MIELPYNRSIANPTPIGHNDIMIGYLGRGKNPRVRRPILFKYSTDQYPVTHLAAVRVKPGSNNSIFMTEIWQWNPNVRAEVIQSDAQRAEELMILLAKELL